MFREIRNQKRALSVEKSIEILNQGEYGVLATIGDDGFPYSTPLSYVYDDHAIYFHCGLEGHKLENLTFSSKVSFSVTTEVELLPDTFSTKYKSVVVFGEAQEIFNEEKESALLLLIHKYSLPYVEKGKEYIQKAKDYTKVYKITLDHMTGKGRIE